MLCCATRARGVLPVITAGVSLPGNAATKLLEEKKKEGGWALNRGGLWSRETWEKRGMSEREQAREVLLAQSVAC